MIMDHREYPIGDDKVPAKNATSVQLREEAEITDDPEMKRRLKEVANWREFLEDLHRSILDGLADKLGEEDHVMVKKLLEWETQSVVEHVLE